ncbi:MAG: hypothetical protein AAGH60_03350 [Pseudomonadota bacterium]
MNGSTTDITLRVVGIFYETNINLGENGGTVEDVLEAAKNAVTTGDSFDYKATPRRGMPKSPEFFEAFYESSFTRGKGSNTRRYEAGTYKLQESFKAGELNPIGEFYSVWQYYILSPDGVLLTRDQEFIPFDDPRAAVPAGGMVIWRLVTIRRNSTEFFGGGGAPGSIGVGV